MSHVEALSASERTVIVVVLNILCTLTYVVSSEETSIIAVSRPANEIGVNRTESLFKVKIHITKNQK